VNSADQINVKEDMRENYIKSAQKITSNLQNLLYSSDVDQKETEPLLPVPVITPFNTRCQLWCELRDLLFEIVSSLNFNHVLQFRKSKF